MLERLTKEHALATYRRLREPGEAWDFLIAEGHPPKRVGFIVEKLERLGFLEIGVSVRFAWRAQYP